MKLNANEIYKVYRENLEARKQADFPMYGSLAIEDTAWMLDISLMEVCKAISLVNSK
jgi:hypothetical protein